MERNEYKEIYGQVPRNNLEGMRLMAVPAPFGIWSFERLDDVNRSKQELSDILGLTATKIIVEIIETQDELD